jgi:hypothetical protein
MNTEKIRGCREDRCYKTSETGICSRSALSMDSFVKDSGSTRLDKVLLHFVTSYLLRKWSLVTEITESKVCQPLYSELELLDEFTFVYLLMNHEIR